MLRDTHWLNYDMCTVSGIDYQLSAISSQRYIVCLNTPHTMKNTAFLFLSIATVISMVSCGGVTYNSDTDPVTAMYDSIDRADSVRRFGPPQEVDCESFYKVNNGQRVSVEGYIRIGKEIKETGNITYLELWQRALELNGPSVMLQIFIGTGKNQRKPLPDSSYHKSDFVVYSDNGDEIHYNDYVRVIGIANIASDGAGWLEIQTVEKVPEKPYDYGKAPAIPVTEFSGSHDALNGKLVTASGYFVVPRNMEVTDVVPMYLSERSNQNTGLPVNLVVGSGPGMIEPFPNQYTEEDIRIHDSKNALINNSKVTVYGTWSDGRLNVEYIVPAE